MRSVRLVFPCHLFHVKGTKRLLKCLTLSRLSYMYLERKYSISIYIYVPQTIKPDGFWHLLQPENIASYHSLSPSTEHTSSRVHTVCAVTFLKTHCPWANDGKENCCLNIYSTPEMSSSHTQKSPLPDSVFTTNVGHQGSPTTLLHLCVSHKPANSLI